MSVFQALCHFKTHIVSHDFSTVLDGLQNLYSTHEIVRRLNIASHKTVSRSIKEKVPLFMDIKGCTHFQHDGAPCHQTKAVKKWLIDYGYEILGPWPGNSPDHI